MLGVDPTFNLGKFYVTITTYTYLYVVNKVTPAFIGPVFVHTEKSYEAYHYFFSTILKLEPNLSVLRVIGTDGEQAPVKAATAVFSGNLIDLRCFIHMKDNICRKLTDMLIPLSARELVIMDIFDTQRGTVYTKGLRCLRF